MYRDVDFGGRILNVQDSILSVRGTRMALHTEPQMQTSATEADQIFGSYVFLA